MDLFVFANTWFIPTIIQPYVKCVCNFMSARYSETESGDLSLHVTLSYEPMNMQMWNWFMHN